jgi:CheY-like chemotaxis protein
MEDALKIFSYQAARKSIIIKTYFDRKTPYEINMARVQVMQVLNNLVSNALKFSPERSYVHVTVGVEEDKWFFTVRDYGVGMSQDTLNKIFIPFFSSGENNVTGTGLGLHIAKKITRRLGGDLKVESFIGNGSEFTAYFPLSPDVVASSSEPAPRPSLMVNAQVLIIDDDFIGTQYYSRILIGMGCTVTVHMTGHLGLEEAERNRPDLVLMDIALPDINGKDLLKKFKEHPKLNTVPVVFITGSFLPGDKEYAMELGAVDYLIKPVMLDSFTRILGKYSFE